MIGRAAGAGNAERELSLCVSARACVNLSRPGQLAVER